MKKLYRVTATVGFEGHGLGDKFEAELNEDAEKRALASGLIRLLQTVEDEEGEGDA